MSILTDGCKRLSVLVRSPVDATYKFEVFDIHSNEPILEIDMNCIQGHNSFLLDDIFKTIHTSHDGLSQLSARVSSELFDVAIVQKLYECKEPEQALTCRIQVLENPVYNILRLKFDNCNSPKTNKKYSYELLDLNGISHITGIIHSSKEIYSLDLSDLQDGIYVMRIQLGSKDNTTIKILKF